MQQKILQTGDLKNDQWALLKLIALEARYLQ